MLLQCYCNVIHRVFVTRPEHIEYVGGVMFAWVLCPYCDTERRTAADADYNPDAPQWHCQRVEQGQEYRDEQEQ